MAGVAPLRPGDPRGLAGYRVVGRLGEGGQGSVFLAHGPGGERAAIKLLHARFGADPTARARFDREVRAARRVPGFCTARVLTADLEGDLPYVVSEFIDGPSLREYLVRRGPLDDGALERLAIGTLTALTAIHQAGIVHRDFKPGNVLMSAEGPRVVDFGIARVLDATSTLTSQAIGTPAYMAPEQFDGRPVTPATDLFAWAATMVHAATGRPPFAADSVAAVVAAVLDGEPGLDGLTGPMRPVIASCLAKDAHVRPGAAELLSRLLADLPTSDDRADVTRRDATRVLTEVSPTFLPPPAQPPSTALHRPDPPPAAPSSAAPPGGPARRRLLIGIGVTGALALASGLAAAPFLLRGRDDRILWRDDINGSQVVRIVVVGNAVVLVLDAGPLYALDAATGRRLWSRDGKYNDLAYSDRGLFAAGADRVEAIDAASGRTLWSISGPAGKIATVGDLVLISTSDAADMYPVPDHVVVTALDAANGERRWSRSLTRPDLPMAGGDRGMLLASARTVAVTAGMLVYGLATAAGKELWQYRIGGNLRAAGVLAGDAFLIGSGNTKEPLHALDAATGKPRWQYLIGESGEENRLSLAADNTTVYVANLGIRALDLRTGRARWRGGYTIIGLDTYGPFGGVLYTSEVSAVDATTGQTLWTDDIKGTATALAATTSTAFLAASRDDSDKAQTVYALRATR
jgi:outer membrane protein assembly factor BamB/predicted Ser/Thr protein kinase